jgi:hypothetical protein
LAAREQITKDQLTFLAGVLREAGMYIRELVFEEVRRESFPTRPSRRYAIWLSELRQIKPWLGWFSGYGKTRRIFEIEATGSFHSGSQRFLDSDIDSFSTYRKNAFEYWKGTGTKNGLVEILFVGQLEVVADVTEEYNG